MSDGNQTGRPDRPIRDAKGLFLPGNPGSPGRPKSSRHKLAEQFFQDLQEIWAASGKGVLRSVLDDKPGDLMRAVAGLMPKEMTVELTNHEEALRELDDSASEEPKP